MEALDLIEQLGQTERTLDQREFVSPVYKTREVATRIDGIIYRFRIPRMHPGWYKFRPKDRRRARVVNPCDLSEVEGYLKHLDRIRLVFVRREGDLCFGVPFRGNSFGMDCLRIVPIYLAMDDMAQEFDEVVCRYDGINIWYESMAMSSDPERAEYLRERLSKMISPSRIKFKGLRFEDRVVYGIQHETRKKEEEQRLLRTTKGRLKRAVEHGGAVFRDYAERRDHFSVTYTIDGEEYTSTVSKNQGLTVQTAGICLSGGDRDFDLASLIGVIREGMNRDLIHRM
jgi:hypothetical protein